MVKIATPEDWIREREASCRICVFFARLSPQRGQCRFENPKPQVRANGDPSTAKLHMWPPIPPNEWCGRFLPRFPFGDPRNDGL